MEDDDVNPRTKTTKPRDLSIMSIEDLEEYIETLKSEIERADAAIKSKKVARQGAESVFKS